MRRRCSAFGRATVGDDPAELLLRDAVRSGGPSVLPEGHKPSVLVYVVGTVVAVGCIAAGIWLMSRDGGGAAE